MFFHMARWIVLTGLIAAAALLRPEGAWSAQHDLVVELFPEENTLRGEDTIHLAGFAADEARFVLARQARILSVQCDGVHARYTFSNGLGRVELPPSRDENRTLRISYEAVFNDSFIDTPASFDNPGQGVRATVFTGGAFLLGGSGWYPATDKDEHIDLTVLAPPGMYAVTSGRRIELGEKHGRAISRWEVRPRGERVALCAGAYLPAFAESGTHETATYFTRELQSLSPVYLSAAAEHVAFYEKLHGPYPFAQFAVVENFFPTGYGFPGFTLLGRQVLALPFIPATSLRHEVAHCWWGNGVRVNFSRGNWCEGLTTYVADYLSKEVSSAEEGREYRVQVLRDYAELASDQDFPVREFASRVSPATRTIGYGKAMFVFHMARRAMGDEAFWRALRGIYAEMLFREATWEDFLAHFADGGLADPGVFLAQWVDRKGAPDLRLDKVRAQRNSEGWLLEGDILQRGPLFSFDLLLRAMDKDGAKIEKVLTVGTRRTSFVLKLPFAPARLEADPEADLFRLLDRDEIPATVNAVKGAENLIVVVSGKAKSMDQSLRTLLAGLNQGGAPVLHESNVTPEELADHDVLYFGMPGGAHLERPAERLPPGLSLLPGGITPWEEGQDSFFLVLRGPGEARVTALFDFAETLSPEEVLSTARKITHYGKYSLLGFSRSRNIVKKTWKPWAEPLAWTFSSKEQ